MKTSSNWVCLGAYARPYWPALTLASLALLVETGASLACPLIIVSMLERATGGHSAVLLDRMGWGLGAVFVVQAGAHFLQTYLLGGVGDRIVHDVRTTLYRQLHLLSMDFHSTTAVGELMSRLSGDVTHLRAMLTTNIAQMLCQTLLLVGAVAVLLTINLRFTILILVFCATAVLAGTYLGRRIERDSVQVQDRLADSMAVAEQGLQAVQVVKGFGREAHEAGRYRAVMERVLEVFMRLNLSNAMLGGQMVVLTWGFVGAVMWFGGREVVEGRLTVAQITGFLFYGLTISSAIKMISDLVARSRAAMSGMQRVFGILAMAPSISDSEAATALEQCEGAISFHDVSFGYHGVDPVIQGLSLHIRAGETVALVGPSGAGKSTLCNLIMRLYDPLAGALCVDGHDLRSLTQESLRQHVGIVPQEPILFGTIRSSIAYGRLDASDAEIVAAAKEAYAHDFIMALPKQYDTEVGQRGTNLSGGQRQRIAIARAILKRPRILLLDEPTSSLDSHCSDLVQAALERLMAGRTTLIVAHQLGTIEKADRIAVLDQGRIAELGTHAQLMANNGSYARMVALQFRAEVAEGEHDRTPLHWRAISAAD